MYLQSVTEGIMQRTYSWSWNWLLRLLGAKFLHGIVVLFLLLSHEDVFISKVQMKGKKEHYENLCVLTLSTSNAYM